MDFANISPPASPDAWLDLDSLDHNIQLVNQKTQAINLRLATKSIRSLDVLHYIKSNSPNYIGLMSYAADESVYLLDNGFTNILCAYPTLDAVNIGKTVSYVENGATMIWMADRIEHLKLLNKVGQAHNAQIDVCLDINMSMQLPKVYFGTKRSALMSKKQVKNLVKEAKTLSYININSVMGYEGQIAGLPEKLPGKTYLAPAIRLLKKQSCMQLSRRRKAIVTYLKKQKFKLKLVNGGGSGSMEFTSSQSEVTEITVGSAYFKPAYFDYMDTMNEFLPAAGFVLPVTRHPEKNVITCHGGGFIASGANGIDKNPVVHYPKNLQILADEGFGEVQTPMRLIHEKDASSVVPAIGEGVWCRHAKAGELCEHFNRLVCYRNSKPEETLNNNATSVMTTYRGEGKCFH